MTPMQHALETFELLAAVDPSIQSEKGAVFFGAALDWLALAGWPEVLIPATAEVMLECAIRRHERR